MHQLVLSKNFNLFITLSIHNLITTITYYKLQQPLNYFRIVMKTADVGIFTNIFILRLHQLVYLNLQQI